MDIIKRYHPYPPEDPKPATMYPHPEGFYVRYEDHIRILEDLRRDSEAEIGTWVERVRSAHHEVIAVLDMIPNAVRVREGGGGEDIYASLAVSVAKLINGGKA